MARGAQRGPGFRDQAKALANAIQGGQDELVAKADLAALESRLKDKLASQQRRCVGLLFVAAGLAATAKKLI